MTPVASVNRPLSVVSGFVAGFVACLLLLMGMRAAAIVGPQFLTASDRARANSLTSDVLTVRSQLELYRIQHLDSYPTLAGFAEQMTGTTDINGDPAGFEFGPYLHQIPANPFTGGARVGNGPVGTSDWFYDPAGGAFRANDSARHARQ